MRRVALPLVLLSLLAAGCGTGDDRSQARSATERFLTAVARHDGAAACGEIAEATGEALEQQEGKDCARAVTEIGVQPAAIARVEVYATGAKVDLANREAAFLQRGPSGWKVSAAGCAHGPKPADHPFTCELED